MSDEQDDGKPDRITVVLPPDVGRRLRARADREGTPVSILIRQWIMRELRQDEPKREQGAGQ
jgi:hypothetical protein